MEEISTRRLVLRRFRESDVGTLAAYRSDPDVARFQSWDAPFPLADAERMVREMSDSAAPEPAEGTLAEAFGQLAAGDPSRPGWFQYAIEHRADRVHIGDIGVNLHENLMQADLGFTIASRYQGKGLGGEAVLGVLERLFHEQGLRRVSAECDARNVASAALLRKVGFTQEGLRPRYTWIKGEWTDDLLFGILSPSASL